MGNLTDKERKIADAEYEKHKYDMMCPHTTNPLQIKELCRRCRSLERLGISVYQMPDKLGGDWACSIMDDYPYFSGIISDGFKTRATAENWAFKKVTGCSLTGKTPSLETELVVQVYPPVPLSGAQ